MRQSLAVARFLLVHRPEHLTERERVQLDALLQSPVGEPLRVARAFLEDWFLLWRDGAGQKRPPAEARARYDRWRADPAYRALAPLRRAQDRLDAARFAQLSHFLRRPEWEATSNGAERMGRQFRHRQAPHFRLRTPGRGRGGDDRRGLPAQASDDGGRHRRPAGPGQPFRPRAEAPLPRGGGSAGGLTRGLAAARGRRPEAARNPMVGRVADPHADGQQPT